MARSRFATSPQHIPPPDRAVGDYLCQQAAAAGADTTDAEADIEADTGAEISALLQRPDVWRLAGNASPNALPHRFVPTVSACPTGHAALDRLLPGGGWPLGATSELLLTEQGVGELRLLMPLFEALAARGEWMAWVAPPYLPYAPSLEAAGVDLSRLLVIRPDQPSAPAGGQRPIDHQRPTASAESLWAAEAALESGAVGAVLLWSAGEPLQMRALRRLQLAAERSGALLFVMRPARAAAQASPAVLRIGLRARGAGLLELSILKSRGHAGAQTLTLSLPEPGAPGVSRTGEAGSLWNHADGHARSVGAPA